MDEIGVVFLATPLMDDRDTELHQRYLREVLVEEFGETDDSFAHYEKPNTARRRQI